MACQHLLLNGSKPDLVDSAGQTPLHRAVSNGELRRAQARTRHRCFDPVRDRPSASRPAPSRQNRLQRRLNTDPTGVKIQSPLS